MSRMISQESRNAGTVRTDVPTVTDTRFYRRPQDRQEFFERVCAQTPPVQPAFLHRPFFTRRKRCEAHCQCPQLPEDEGT